MYNLRKTSSVIRANKNFNASLPLLSASTILCPIIYSRLFVIFIILFYPFFSNATEIRKVNSTFKHINTVNNVELGEVNTISQDSKGFLWLGSNNGLHKYDGYELRSYQHERNNLNSLANNSVLKIIPDDNYNLWLATFGGGLNRLNLNNENFTRFKSTTDSSSLKTNRLWNIHPGGDNKILISSHRGLDIFNTKTLINHRVSHKSEIPINVAQAGVWSTFKDSNNRLWLATLGRGVYIYNNIDKSVKHIKQTTNNSGLIHNFVRTITEDTMNNIWIGTDDGISVYNSQKSIFHHYQHIAGDTSTISGNAINVIFQDSLGLIWIGTYGQGLNMYNPDSGKFTRFNKSNFPPNIINDIFEDSSGNLWFATEQGIVQLTPSARKFSRFTTNKADSLIVSAIFESAQKHIWLGTNFGVYKLDINQNKYQLIFPDITDSLFFNEDKQKNIWIASQSSGLHKVTPDGSSIHTFSIASGELQSDSIAKIIFDTQNNLWVALIKQQADKGGFVLFDQQEGTIKNFFEKENIVDILEVNDDHLLVATNDFGVALFDKTSNKLFKITKTSNSNVNGNQLQTTALFKDSKSRVWVTTDGNGLWEYIQKSKILIYHPEVKIESIRGITESADNELWLTTANNLVSYKPENNKIRIFDITHGLHNTSFTKRTALISHNKKIYLGTTDGLIAFSPREIKTNNIAPKTTITSLKILNEPVIISSDKPGILNKAIEITDKIVLTQEDYLFSLKFSSLSFIGQHKGQYAYKMVGLDNDWLTTNAANRIATYTTLPHGDYVFKVKSSNADGVWDNTGASIKIKVLPTFWQTKQAYITYLLLVLLFIYLYTQLRVKSVETKAKKLEVAIQQRTYELEDSNTKLELKNKVIFDLLNQKRKIFANVSHEFRTPLTLILNPIENLLYGEEDKQKQNDFLNIKRNANRLLKMVDQLLDIALLESNQQHQLQHYNLAYTVLSIVEAFRSLANKNNIQIIIKNSTNKEVGLLLLSDSLEKILMNLLSNAIKYSKDNGVIEVTISTVNRFVKIDISDNGYGIAEKELEYIFDNFYRGDNVEYNGITGAGIGLSIVRELVIQNNGVIEVNSTINRGSSFIISLPVASDIELKVLPVKNIKDTDYLKLEIESLSTKPIIEKNHLNHNSQLSKTILIIEDNVEMRNLLVNCFKEEFNCITAPHGALGIELANKVIPDCIICDVMMPILDGYEVAKELRNNENTSHIPIIMLTAKGDNESRMLGWDQNVDDYITKPFSEKELKKRISNILDIRNILRKKFGGALSSSSITETIDKFNFNEKDKSFLTRFEKIISENYQHCDFNRIQASEKMALSERQLNRKLAALVDYNFSEYLRKFRLRQAINLFGKGLQVAEIGDQIGFSSTAYFGACFKAEYSKTVRKFELELISKNIEPTEV